MACRVGVYGLPSGGLWRAESGVIAGRVGGCYDVRRVQADFQGEVAFLDWPQSSRPLRRQVLTSIGAADLAISTDFVTGGSISTLRRVLGAPSPYSARDNPLLSGR